jgi:hypothetical protein
MAAPHYRKWGVNPGKVLSRYEVWYTPDAGPAERLGRFAVPTQRRESIQRARAHLDARQSLPGLIEIHDAHSAATIYRERYPRAEALEERIEGRPRSLSSRPSSSA